MFDKTNSKKYWSSRSIYLENNINKDTVLLEKRLFKVYTNVQKEIKSDINDFLLKHSSADGTIILSDVVQRMTPAERRAYEKNINSILKDYNKYKNNPFVEAEIRYITSQVYITRLQALENELSARLGVLTAYTQQELTDHLVDVYNTSYAYNMEGLGITSFNLPSTQLVSTSVNQPWSGAMFSDRLWLNKGRMVANLHKTLNEGIAQGKAIQRMASELAYRTEGSYANSVRVIRTESNYILNQSTATTYRDAGVKEYEFLAEIDDRTSEECSALDGDTFRLSERQAGTNYPPLHPNCRSTVIPVI
jgi:SPP1 gp7 family putative phage head morphogenesis protein